MSKNQFLEKKDILERVKEVLGRWVILTRIQLFLHF